ncbi:hypothetical protein [Streptomyces sp. NPDC101234]|uniref:hypothetical protein n=1 Tax=Streptomyces sp. NPDC101234 TaxID=3366138 RepID=UPI003828AB29
MRVGSVTQGSRSRPWAGAVVVALLAMLLHLLACAHGPTTTEGAGVDSLLLASPTACGQLPAATPRQPVVTDQSSPAQDPEGHCCSLDGPTVQPPRPCDRPAVAPAPDAQSAVPSSDDAVMSLPAPGPAAARPPLSAGHTRARLGVWRT